MSYMIFLKPFSVGGDGRDDEMNSQTVRGALHSVVQVVQF